MKSPTWLALTCALTACGSDSSTPPKQDASGSNQPHDAAPHLDAPADSSQVVIDAPAGTTALTIMNTLAWCSVTVGNNAASAAATKVYNVQPGTISLSATAETGFMLSTTMWHHTAGDSGGGEAGMVTGSGPTASSATTVVVGTTAKCVWVCCPSTTVTTDCNIADPCP